MSLKKQAIQRIADLDADQVRRLVVRRITGDDTVPLGSHFSDEAGEDLVIWLLREQDLPEEMRRAVISGCELVYSQVLAWLAAPKHTNGGNDLEDVATRLCRVVDVAGPGELRHHADAMLNLACTAQDLPSRILPAAVRACMPYGSTPDHVPLWEQLLKRREVAAYAFNALLAIDPHAPRITKALAMLWRKQLCDEWNVDTAFLARRAARLSGSQNVIQDSLRAVLQDLLTLPDHGQLRQSLLTDLDRRSWSQHWIQHLRPEREAAGHAARKGWTFQSLLAKYANLFDEVSASSSDSRDPISMSLNPYDEAFLGAKPMVSADFRFLRKFQVADNDLYLSPAGHESVVEVSSNEISDFRVLYVLQGHQHVENKPTRTLRSAEVGSSFEDSIRILYGERAESVKLHEVYYPGSTVRKTTKFSFTQK